MKLKQFEIRGKESLLKAIMEDLIEIGYEDCSSETKFISISQRYNTPTKELYLKLSNNARANGGGFTFRLPQDYVDALDYAKKVIKDWDDADKIKVGDYIFRILPSGKEVFGQASDRQGCFDGVKSSSNLPFTHFFCLENYPKEGGVQIYDTYEKGSYKYKKATPQEIEDNKIIPVTIGGERKIYVKKGMVMAGGEVFNIKHIKNLFVDTNTFGNTDFKIVYQRFDIGCWKGVERRDLEKIIEAYDSINK